MVQLVYVHGVSVRKRQGSSDYDLGVWKRHSAFQFMGFNGGSVEFYDPYWGEYGAADPATFKSLNLSAGPLFTVKPLAYGGESDFSGDLSGSFLLDAAIDNFSATVNSLSIVLADDNEKNLAYNRNLSIHLADLVVTVDDESPLVLGITNNAQSDQEFLSNLVLAATNELYNERTGFLRAIQKAAKWLLNKTIRLASNPLAKVARNATPALAVFLGDAIIYLKGNRRGDSRFKSIRDVIKKDLRMAAIKARASSDKLIVVGHSMGANILYDMISDPDFVKEIEDEIGDTLQIDLFLSVGTQVGLLNDLGLFGPKPLARPSCCKRWWHVFNQMDVLSFGIGENSDGYIDQFSCDTNANILDAHNSYFTSPVFQRRLYKRLKQVGLAS